MTLKTTDLLKNLSNLKSEETLNTLIKKNFSKSPSLEFKEYFNNILLEKNIKKSTIVNESSLSRSYCYEIFRGEKVPDRDSALKLAISANLNLDETNRILKLTNNSILYPKIDRDFALIFCINNNYSIINTDLLLDSYNFEPLSKF